MSEKKKRTRIVVLSEHSRTSLGRTVNIRVSDTGSSSKKPSGTIIVHCMHKRRLVQMHEVAKEHSK